MLRNKLNSMLNQNQPILSQTNQKIMINKKNKISLTISDERNKVKKIDRQINE